MKEGTRLSYKAAVLAAIARIRAGLDEALDLNALARLAYASPLHFHRIFRGMAGETPLEMHRRLRLERAAHQLATNDDAVTMIAFDAGFETHEAFTRAFQAAYAQAPSEFRRRIRLHRARMNADDDDVFPFTLRSHNGVHFHADADLPLPDLAQGDFAMDVVIEDLPPRRVFAVTHIGPQFMIGEGFVRLAKTAGPALMAQGLAVAIFHDDQETTPANELRSSAGIIVPDDAPAPPGLEEMRIPGGKHARTTFVGHYRRLPDAWAKFMGQWLPNSGHRVADRSSFEIYRVNDHSRPDELETDLYIPLE